MSMASEKQLLKARTYREGLDKASRERYDGKLIYLNVGRLFRLSVGPVCVRKKNDWDLFIRIFIPVISFTVTNKHCTITYTIIIML